MKAAIDRFYSSDVDPIDRATPSNPANFGVPVDMYIRLGDHKGSDYYEVLVCTPSYLENEVKDGSAFFARHTLVVNEWDWATIENALRNAIETLDAPTREELIALISRVGRWEFEDYKPDESSER